ncbi:MULTISPECIES: pilus assembly protein PilM [unclassified Acinetobacter]|uniref:pilus assembly protein PilM n=1 Tax=unclassified Acinetobacter TaxID=196816 RepID=UPI0029341A52|nr:MULTISPECIES: pilus assembly protein PilM [unclassified Acinetobacter]WOE31065.1 pilus assembly protein PilM [Acinetobacter sp. SAAs470]WOE39261.1 pilus assembly protein PilM [Acinetobacter sp. SAAs474]
MFGVLSRPSKGLVGVDISSTSVKLLKLSLKNDGYCLENYAVVPLIEGSIIEKNIINAEAVVDAIKQAMKLIAVSRHDVAFALPTSLVVTKTMEMDADVPDDEREVQIRLDAEQYIPFPLDELILDFALVSNAKNLAHRVNILLVATRIENVETRRNVIELAGLIPKVADVEMFAIENVLGTFTDLCPVDAGIIVILDIGHTTTTLSVLEQYRTIYNREQVFGGKQLTDAIQQHYHLSFLEAEYLKKNASLPDDYRDEVLDPFLNLLIQHVQRALQFFFSSSAISDIDYILLTGGCANIMGLTQWLQQELGYPVMMINPFLNMKLSRKISPQQLANDAPALIVACGLALRSFDQ